MAVEDVGTLLARLKMDAKQFSASITQANKSLDLTTKASALARKSFIALTVAGTALAAGAAVLGKRFLTTASTVEQYQFQLAALLGSQEAASAAMDRFREVAAQVPKSLDEIIEAGTILERFGANSDVWLEPIVDLSFVMGVSLPEAASAFGRAFAAGAGAADIFRERGVLQLIKDAQGIQDLTDLTLPQFRKAMMETFTDPEGRIAGAAKDAATTWEGAMSMIGDAWFNFKTDVMEAGVFEFMKGIADLVVGALKDADTEALVKDIATAVITGMNAIVQAVLTVPSAIQGVRKFVTDTEAAILELLRDILEVMDRFKFLDPTGLWDVALADVDITLGAIDARVEKLAEDSFDFEQSIEEWNNRLAPFGAKVQELANQLLLEIDKTDGKGLINQMIFGDGDEEDGIAGATEQQIEDAQKFQQKILALNFDATEQLAAQLEARQDRLREIREQGALSQEEIDMLEQELQIWHQGELDKIQKDGLDKRMRALNQFNDTATDIALGFTDLLQSNAKNQNKVLLSQTKTYIKALSGVLKIIGSKESRESIIVATKEFGLGLAAAAGGNFVQAGLHFGASTALFSAAADIINIASTLTGGAPSTAGGGGGGGRGAGGGGFGAPEPPREERDRGPRREIIFNIGAGVIEKDIIRELAESLNEAEEDDVKITVAEAT